MQGEYRGDFTRDTFDPTKRFLRVLYQQGRVQLDADHNEQVSILLHYLQSLAKDLFGEHGGPCDSGFLITPTQTPSTDFNIGHGHYYVDGILCEATDTTYRGQPDSPVAKDEELTEGSNLVYLDVWERHITHIEDDLIREVALGGPDTATRAKVVWQVKAWNVGEGTFTETLWNDLQEQWQPAKRGHLRAKGKETPKQETAPCITSPESRYRGAENQLYRVEIHTGSNDKRGNPTTPTFKWSRENGSVTFPIREFTGNNVVVLEHLGRDSRFGLAPGDWVEIVDDDYVLQRRAEPLLQVDAIDPDTRQVTLKAAPASTVGQALEKHPLLRRWDHKAGNPNEGGLQLDAGAAIIIEGANNSKWLVLEDGILVQFQSSGPPATYRTGDYWLIPARTATGDVEWPGDVGNPEAMPPHGVEHDYAPLAIISVVSNVVTTSDDLRSTKQLAACTPSRRV